MQTGYFLRLGDKTTCGGIILNASSISKVSNQYICCEFDRVTCGKNAGEYTIIGGINFITYNGKRLAGTLDSRSSCPCNAMLLTSWFTGRYEKKRSAVCYSSLATLASAHLAANAPIYSLAAVPMSEILAASAYQAQQCDVSGTEVNTEQEQIDRVSQRGNSDTLLGDHR